MFRVAAGLKLARRALLEGTILAAVGTAVLQIFSTELLASAGRNPILAPFAIIIGLLIWFNLVSQVYLVSARLGRGPGEDLKAGPRGRRRPAGAPARCSRAKPRVAAANAAGPACATAPAGPPAFRRRGTGRPTPK